MPGGVDAATAAALRHAVATSFVAGFRWVMLLGAGLALLSALVAWWTIDGLPIASTRAEDPSHGR
jgi:hypothetical protein